jgi:hypothetical protein
MLLAVGLLLAPLQPHQPSPQRNAQYIENALSWLAKAQFDNGGWGAGSHNRQDIRDPKAVQVDPATTALSAMALVRAGNTLKQGEYADNVRRALTYLLEQVEASPEESSNITTLSGTQPQTKLGSNIDVSLCAQFFTRILHLNGHPATTKKRVTAALDKCLRKLQRAQNSDGSFAGGTWAGVLQSAMANSALESGKAAGREVDEKVLERSKAYQQGNLDVESGEVRTDAAAGVSLYALTGTQRATARDARKTEELMKEGKDSGLLDKNAEPTVSNLVKAGAPQEEAERLHKAYTQNEMGRKQLEDEQVLSGFGNNGGEEYLSHMMTSESLVITGGNDWAAWSQKMGTRFEKIQNPNGSWSGHHCITSPVFCTAAVVLAMTAERDAELLVAQGKR